jgi:hypothetical protein
LERNTFSLAGVKANVGLVVKCDAYIGRYYSQVCSAGYLEYELLAAIMRRAIGRLPSRMKLLESYASTRECLLSGGGVDATMAISTLVVYKRRRILDALQGQVHESR